MRWPWQDKPPTPAPVVDPRPLRLRIADAEAKRRHEKARRESEAVATAVRRCQERIGLTLGVQVDVWDDDWTIISRDPGLTDDPDLYGPLVTLRGTVDGIPIEGRWAESFCWEFGAPATEDGCSLYVGHGKAAKPIWSLADLAGHAAASR